MGFSHVGTDDEDAIGFFDIGIAANGLICTKRGKVAANGTGHAEPGVSFHIVGLQTAAEHLLEEIGLFGEGLTGAVIGYGIIAMLLHCRTKFFCGNIQGFVPGNGLKLVCFFGPVERSCQPISMIHDFPEMHTLHAHISVIGS